MSDVANPEQSRLRMSVRGVVQGVGFRPFVYRLANDLGLRGWVNNSSQGVFIEVEGKREVLHQFLLRLEAEQPPLAVIQSLETTWLDPVGYSAFEIRASEESGQVQAYVSVDIATCHLCADEIFNPQNRRFRYPFTNCTNCGPRFTIIEALPYDRRNTSMKGFTMCKECQAEYDNPLDRRFHAQPNACPVCGPQVELWDSKGKFLAATDLALVGAAQAIREGNIVAVKGLGGFHLMVLAELDGAVRRLRELKHREEKPLAVMFPALEQVKQICELNDLEARLLCSPEAPIVLLRRKGENGISPLVAPGNPNLGVMIPYTPLHLLLLAEVGAPVVATSGNLSDEPICIDERDAVNRLGRIADLFLVHNRPIVRHVDDSIARVMLGRELVLRRARGYAPFPVLLKKPLPPTLAVGAHLKNAVALAIGREVFISQHIGDLETPEAFGAFRRVIGDLERLYQVSPAVVAADKHPDYLSTRFAHESGPNVIGVQHHFAHVFSCMAENELEGPVFGISWDGTGYGDDGSIWGGEFLLAGPKKMERLGHFRTFRLPGGDTAVREPRRAALGLLYEMLGDAVFERKDLTLLQAFSPAELGTIRTMLSRGFNAPLTSSAGRLFDVVASLTGLRQVVRFEGQGAMELEFVLKEQARVKAYECIIRDTAKSGLPWIVDWEPMFRQILNDVSLGIKVDQISAKFHSALAGVIVAAAEKAGQEKVVLSGGCFQNRHLTEKAVARLQGAGFRPYWHQRVPPNDGGIALGQIVAAAPMCH